MPTQPKMDNRKTYWGSEVVWQDSDHIKYWFVYTQMSADIIRRPRRGVDLEYFIFYTYFYYTNILTLTGVGICALCSDSPCKLSGDS